MQQSRHFANNRKLNINIDFKHAPESFHRVPRIKLVARANIYVDEINTDLSLIAQGANSKRIKKIADEIEEKRPPVERTTKSIEKELSALDKAAYFFFDAFGSPVINEISAQKAFTRLDPQCEFEYWISRLMYEFEMNHSGILEIDLVGETDAKYKGNFYISDILFRRKLRKNR